MDSTAALVLLTKAANPAISRVTITQTAPTGFAEGQVSFQHRTAKAAPRQPDPAAAEEARRIEAQLQPDEDEETMKYKHKAGVAEAAYAEKRNAD